MDLEICLLGGFEARIQGRAIPEGAWGHRRAQELVKILALSEGHRIHKEQIMDSLWPELTPEAAAANLRKAVHFARRILGSDEAIATTGEMVRLWPKASVTVDAAVFEEVANAALTDGEPRALAKAAELYAGEVLPEDRYASWAEQPRERLRMRALEVLRSAALWNRVLEIDPADEEAHRSLMQRALDSGDRSGAIRQFELLRDRLRTDLGMGPDEASVALYEKALAMEGAEPPNPAERVRAQLAWGLVHLNSGDLDEAERTAEEARSLAIEEGLGREIGEASALLGIVANMRGRWKELFRAEFVSSVRRSPELASFVFDAHLCLAEFVLCGPAGHEDVAGYARELLEVAETSRSIQGRALAELLLGEVALFSGRIEDAEDHLGSSEALHQQAGAVSGRVIALQRLAEASLARGRRWHARRLSERGLRLAQDTALAPHLLVRMHGTLVEVESEPSGATQVIRDADAALAGGVVCPPCSMGFRVAAAISLARAGRIDEARTRLDEGERLAGMWPGGPWHASVWEARGVLREMEGDRAQAAALYREAADRFETVRRPLDVARCHAAADALKD